MQVKVDRLREFINLVQPVVPKKHTLEILSNILLKDGQAVATDLETMVVMELPEIDEPYLLPYRKVKELLRYVDGGSQLIITNKDGHISFVWDDGKATLECGNPEDYPPLPEIKDPIQGSIDGDKLVPALQSVARYCSSDDARAALTGVSFSLNKTIELAAGDGFRMAYQILPIEFPSKGKTIIPAHSIEVLAGLWKKIPPPVPLADSIIHQVLSKRQVELTIGKTGMKARFGRVSVIVKTIQGNSPAFKDLIPKDPPTQVRVFAPDLELAVRRCAAVASDNNGIVTFEWEDETLKVSAKSDGDNSIEASVRVQTEGEPGTVAINHKYLLEYLAGKEGLLLMCVTSKDSPVLFRYSSAPMVVMMPMFTKPSAS